MYEEDFGKGAFPDPIDQTVKEYDHLALGASPFNWEQGFDIEEELGITFPVKDQGPSPSCTGQGASSLAYALNAIELKKAFGDRLQEFLVELSAKSIYSQIALKSGQGAYLKDAAKALVEYGINTEQDVPSYEDGKPPKSDFMFDKSWKTEKLTEKAKNYQGKEPRMIQANWDIDLMAQAIRDNGGVLIGVNGENNGTWHLTFPKPPIWVKWRHCMYGGKAKLINGKKYIGVLNSWNKKTGENGWQWFGEEWFKTGNFFNPWVVVDKDNIERVKLLDRDGKPRLLPTYMFKAIRYLVGKRGYSYAK